MTSQPKSEAAPDNLFAPIAGHDTVRDGLPALRHSFSNRLTRRVIR